MTLKDKFQQWFINDEDEHYEGMVETVAIEHEQIADEFAIGFAEWFWYHGTKYWRGERTDYLDMSEILEIYKKENEL
jgi:hypothetical protein